MLRLLFVLVALACSGHGANLLFAQQGAPARVQVAYAASGVAIDAEDSEWAGVTGLRLDRRSQLVATGRIEWAGPEDASAIVRLLYDEGHLYIFARLLDQGPLAQRRTETWESGDVLELFFDCDLRDGRVGEMQWNEDDLQLMLLPHAPGRPWATIGRPEKTDARGSTISIDDRGFTGIEIARRVFDGGVDLEVAIPLHNLPGFEPGLREIGFNVAFGDRDPGRDSYHYLVWAGSSSPAVNTSNFGRLEFAGPAPLVARTPARDGLTGWIPNLVGALLPAMFALLLLLLARHVYQRSLAEHVQRRWLVVRASIFVLIAALVVPWAMTFVRERGTSVRAAEIATWVREALPVMENGSIGSLQGARRDKALVDVLSGGEIRQPTEYRFHRLSSIDPKAMGWRARHFDGDVSIWSYRIPLSATPTRLTLSSSDHESGVRFVFSEFFDEADVLGEPVAPEVRVSDALATAPSAETWLQLSRVDSIDSDAPGRIYWAGEIDLADGVREVSLTSATQDRELVLEGASAIHAAGSSPLFLETVSRLGVGVPTELFGGFPIDSRVRIAPGTHWRCRLPKAISNIDKIWLLVAGLDSAEFRETTDGAKVANCVVGRAPGPNGRALGAAAFELLHQRHVFSRRKDANSELQRIVGLDEKRGGRTTAQIAYEWQTTDASMHITPGIAIDLGEWTTVRELTISNTGTYPIELRSIVFAEPRLVQGEEPSESPLVSSGPRGTLRLSSDARDLVGDASIHVFREGRLSASRFLDSRSVPSDVLEDLRDRESVDTRDFFGPGSFESWFRPGGEDWGDATIAVAVRDAGLGDYRDSLWILGGILVVLAAPWLLVHLLQTVAPVGSLRVQLLGSVAFAAIVPLVLLSFFLVNLLEQNHAERQRSSLLRDLAIAERRIDEAATGLVLEARDQARKLAKEVERQRRAAKDDTEALRRAMRDALSLARPKGWSDASFLAAELPDAEKSGRVLRVVDREESRLLGDTPLGPDPGLYLRWGKLFVGARAEDGTGVGLRCALGRVLDANVLEDWVARGLIGVFGLGGYPLAVGSAAVGESVQRDFVRTQRLPGARAALRGEIDKLLEGGKPIVASLEHDRDDWIAALSLLRDRGGQPVAVLASCAQPDRASLPLLFGAVGVRSFFVIVGSLLLVLVSFLTLSVTGRISKPIEQIGQFALRYSKGDLTDEVDPLHGSDEVAALNDAFRTMAAELRSRISKQEHMNRAMSRLTSVLELDAVAREATQILTEASGAHEASLFWVDRHRADAAHEFASRVGAVSWREYLMPGLRHACGPYCVEMGETASGTHALVLPIRLRERARAAAVLTWHGAMPDDVDLEYVQALLDQIASAMETARLYGLAIEDAVTGLPVERFFRRRVAQEVDRAQQAEQHVALARLEVLESSGFSSLDLAHERIAAELSSMLEPPEIASRVGTLTFELLLPGVDRRQAEARLEDAQQRIARLLRVLDPAAAHGIRATCAVYPEDAVSSAFLVESLDQQSHAREVSPARSDVVERGSGIFASPVMHAVLDQIEKAATTELTVLLEGETGTGKEILANLCHEHSARAHGPLVKVNCAAIPESLLESALFGHERGAFTGAIERHRGFFEQADRGTLFLDEVGEMPLELQAKLLRVLQDGKIRRLGGSDDLDVDVRVLAATHRDLRSLVASGEFRQDLFFRLQGVRIPVPALRDRKEEIPILVEHCRVQFSDAAKPISPAALDALYAYSWPGNVRELQNVVQRALVLAGGDRIEPEDLDLAAVPAPPQPARAPEAQGDGAAVEETPVSTLAPDADTPRRGVPVGAPDSNSLRPQQTPAERWARLVEAFETDLDLQKLGLSPKRYRELVQVSRRTATRDLGAWLGMGRLVAQGQKRALRYRIAPMRGLDVMSQDPTLSDS